LSKVPAARGAEGGRTKGEAVPLCFSHKKVKKTLLTKIFWGSTKKEPSQVRKTAGEKWAVITRME